MSKEKHVLLKYIQWN